MKNKLHAEPLEGHQSTFFFPSSKLLLTVYVDDFVLSGPESAHDPFWAELSKHVKLEEISGLGRFLGRYHELCVVKANQPLCFQ